MKRIILLTISAIFLSVNLIAQCNVSIQNTQLDTLDVPCGSQVLLERDTLGAYAIYNDFNSGSVGLGWQTTSNAALNNPCGAKGSTYLWFGNTSTAPRNLTTVPLDLSCGGQICFELRFSIQGGSQPCEGPDLAGEGVTFEWRQGAGTWNTINYFQPNTSGSFNSQSPGSGDYTGWATYCYPIPLAAQGPNIQIRWQQYASTAAGNDHWGLDSITVSTNCGAVTNVWSTGDSGATTSVGPVLGDSLIWSQRVVGVGSASPDTCYDTLIVRAQLPRVNANPQFVPFCKGTDAVVGVNPGQIQFADPNVTYNTAWHPQVGLFDSTSAYYARIDQLTFDTTVWYTFEHPNYPQCSTADTVQIEVGGVEFDTVNVFNPLCFRDQDAGSVYFSWKNEISGPITTLLRNGTWNNATATQQFTNLPNDTFTLAIRDARCFDTVGFRLETPDTLRIDTSKLVTEICQTIDKAQLVDGINGIAPYQSFWDGNSVSPFRIKAKSDTTVSVFIKDAADCISDTLAITFTVPDPILINQIEAAVCPGDSLTMVAQASGGLGAGSYIYRWHNNVQDSVVHVVPQPGNSYQVRVEDGCTFYASMIPDVEIYPVPDDGLSITPEACLGDEILIEAPAGMANYQIVVNQNDTLINQTNSYLASDTGSYMVYLYTETMNGCEKGDTNSFRILPLPVSKFSFDTTALYQVRVNSEVLFLNESEHASKQIWSTIDEQSSEYDFLHEFEEPGKFRVQLVSANHLGCSDTSTAFIDIQPDRQLLFPNSFTPNQDGLNDTWDLIIPDYIEEFDVWVYDRWGNLVWESHDINNSSWDGRESSTGELVQSGVYVYRLFVAAPKNEIEYKEELTGSVHVIDASE